jgi:ketosteroid isomerase-like protein
LMRLWMSSAALWLALGSSPVAAAQETPICPPPSAPYGVTPTCVKLLTQPAPSAPDLVAIYQQSLDAQMRGDVDGVLSLLTDDAVFQGTGRCNPLPCIGKAAIADELAGRISNQDQLTRLDAHVVGNLAIVRVEVRANSVREAGIERLMTTSLVEFRGTKIAHFSNLLDLADPQTVQYLQARIASTAPEALKAGTP